MVAILVMKVYYWHFGCALCSFTLEANLTKMFVWKRSDHLMTRVSNPMMSPSYHNWQKEVKDWKQDLGCGKLELSFKWKRTDMIFEHNDWMYLNWILWKCKRFVCFPSFYTYQLLKLYLGHWTQTLHWNQGYHNHIINQADGGRSNL